MQWRVILAACIIAGLLAGGLVSLHHTAKLCTQVSSPLEQLSAQLQQKAPADLALLQQAPLEPEAMSKFVARSNDIMMLLTH